MKYPYSSRYQPPCPVVEVVLSNSEEGLRTAEMNALLDTGSDGSLVPLAYLQQILAPALVDARIRSHWGQDRAVQLFLVDIELGDLRLPGILVVGDEQGDEVVLGRNILNKLRLVLDGPASQTIIPAQ
jgi:predicted aspartyl protease